MESKSEVLQENETCDVTANQVAGEARRLMLGILLVAIHSVLLGVIIFLFTEPFYKFFFGAKVENFFFVRQSGLFLLCLGLFYVIPLLDLPRYSPLVIVIIITKVFAVVFLGLHAQHVPRPGAIILAALIDGTMAICLAWLFIMFKRSCPNNL